MDFRSVINRKEEEVGFLNSGGFMKISSYKQAKANEPGKIYRIFHNIENGFPNEVCLCGVRMNSRKAGTRVDES